MCAMLALSTTMDVNVSCLLSFPSSRPSAQMHPGCCYRCIHGMLSHQLILVPAQWLLRRSPLPNTPHRRRRQVNNARHSSPRAMPLLAISQCTDLCTGFHKLRCRALSRQSRPLTERGMIPLGDSTCSNVLQRWHWPRLRRLHGNWHTPVQDLRLRLLQQTHVFRGNKYAPSLQSVWNYLHNLELAHQCCLKLVAVATLVAAKQRVAICGT